MLSKFSDFVNSDDWIWKSHQHLSDYIHFCIQKDLKLIKDRFFLGEKWEIQLIISMTMLTRSSEIFFNPMPFSGHNNMQKGLIGWWIIIFSKLFYLIIIYCQYLSSCENKTKHLEILEKTFHYYPGAPPIIDFGETFCNLSESYRSRNR